MKCLHSEAKTVVKKFIDKSENKNSVRLHFGYDIAPLWLERDGDSFYLSRFAVFRNALRIVWTIEILRQNDEYYPVAIDDFFARAAMQSTSSRIPIFVD